MGSPQNIALFHRPIGCKCCKDSHTNTEAKNWLYVDADNASVDEAARKVIEVMRNASSTMLKKASVDDISKAFTI